DVLARHGVVLAELQLLRGGAGVLLGDVVVAGVGGANQLDQNGVLLGHGLTSIAGGSRGRAPPYWLAGGCQASASGSRGGSSRGPSGGSCPEAPPSTAASPTRRGRPGRRRHT